ncbi:MAG: RNA-binding protein, partial [Gammaproteobacteria bacterium]
RHLHRAPQKLLEDYAQGKKLWAWELKNARRYPTPVPLPPGQGQMMWVKIAPRRGKGSP